MDTPFFPMSESDIDAIGDSVDVLGDIYRGDLGGCVVRGFVPPHAAQRARERLEAGAYPVQMRLRDPAGRAQTSGFGLGDTASDLDGYAAQTPSFREHFPTLFDELPGIERRFEDVLTRVSNRRQARVATSPAGAPYLPMLIRRLAAGGAVPPHFELQVLQSASYGHLKTVVDTTTIISFFFQLGTADAGGELYVHDVRWDPHSAEALADGGKALPRLMAERAEKRIELGVGDLVFFDSGRYIHRVTAVEGSRPRWTIGGFLCRGADGASVHYWA